MLTIGALLGSLSLAGAHASPTHSVAGGIECCRGNA
jgi:hypothetical protein